MKVCNWLPLTSAMVAAFFPGRQVNCPCVRASQWLGDDKCHCQVVQFGLEGWMGCLQVRRERWEWVLWLPFFW